MNKPIVRFATYRTPDTHQAMLLLRDHNILRPVSCILSTNPQPVIHVRLAGFLSLLGLRADNLLIRLDPQDLLASPESPSKQRFTTPF